LLSLSAACASVGTSDPTLVRAEDVLSNSLSVWDQAMKWHFANSTHESPQVYQVFEKVRINFPLAWKALYDGTIAYRTNPDRDKLEALITAVRSLLDQLATVPR
jgi:hypothetical protein